jgi:succinylarginine dihydrolase
VPLADAIRSYLFNAQLVTRPNGEMTLIVPGEARETASVWRWIERHLAGNGPIRRVEVVDVRQSMANGGGPACLRLRVPLTLVERGAMRCNVVLDPALDASLEAWIRRHYRDRLAPSDLRDPALLDETRRALDELIVLLKLPPVYRFQGA